jgi:glycosyltransferase involved in cell wall biosynthesis
MVRVGFVFAFRDRGWLGGISYYRNLLWAIARLDDRKIEPVIFTGGRTPPELLEGLPPFRVVRTPMLDDGHPSRFARQAWFRATGRDAWFERCLAREGVAVLSHHRPLGKRARVPTLGWIPDFQHLHLPELFSDTDIAQRERLFEGICRGSARILVSSHHAQRDLRRRHPADAARSRVLQFVATVDTDPGKEPTPVATLERKYGFTAPYFHLPNQLWVHKNHGVAIEALKVLQARGQRATILATGNTLDPRHPEYCSELQHSIAQAGLEDSFRILGVVPYADLLGLMRGAIALINPSRFEGWSTTVEEAKSLNKRILLSDIPVHREQAPARGNYFAPDDAAGLADAIAAVLADSADLGTPDAMAGDRDLEHRRHCFARTYQDIVLELAN